MDAGLHELLTELNNGKRLTGRAVGNILTYRRDRVANGLKLERLAGNSKGHNYRVVKVWLLIQHNKSHLLDKWLFIYI